MRYISREELPDKVKNNEIPLDENKKQTMHYNQKIRTSGGFVDAMFLGSAMIVCFLWALLAVTLRG